MIPQPPRPPARRALLDDRAVRTLTPILAGWLIAKAVRLGVDLDPETATAIATVIWYEAGRILEHRTGRHLMLGAPMAAQPPQPNPPA